MTTFRDENEQSVRVEAPHAASSQDEEAEALTQVEAKRHAMIEQFEHDHPGVPWRIDHVEHGPGAYTMLVVPACLIWRT